MIKSVQSLCFSPTGGTRRILSAISKSIGLTVQPEIDLTLERRRKKFQGEVTGDIVLIGSPVYGGTIPYPFLESLKQLKG